MSHPSVRQRIAAISAGVLAAGVTVVTGASLANAATTGCTVTYTVQNQWPGGFTAAVSITNLGSALNGWTLAFDFPAAGQQVGQAWSATWAQSGQHVTATSLELEREPRHRRVHPDRLQRRVDREQPGADRVHAQRRGLHRVDHTRPVAEPVAQSQLAAGQFGTA